MRLVIDSQLKEIRRAMELVDEFQVRHGLVDNDAHAIHVLIDEVLSNSIRHGLGGAASHAIAVTLDLVDREIVVAVEDDGIAYDPTQASAPVLADALGDRKPGGLGLAIMRSFTDSIEYRRIDGRNHLVLRRRIASPQGAAPAPDAG